MRSGCIARFECEKGGKMDDIRKKEIKKCQRFCFIEIPREKMPNEYKKKQRELRTRVEWYQKT